MAKRIKPGEPAEIPQPGKNPEIKPATTPEEPVWPEEEPAIIPEEEPDEPSPGEIPIPPKEK